MREICKSGLKRAEAAGTPAPPLLDWLTSGKTMCSFSFHTAVGIFCSIDVCRIATAEKHRQVWQKAQFVPPAGRLVFLAPSFIERNNPRAGLGLTLLPPQKGGPRLAFLQAL